MHELIDNNNAPLNILKLFQKTSSIQTYNTWSYISGNFYVQSSRLEIHKRSLSRFGVKLWNEIGVASEIYPRRNLKEKFAEFSLDILGKEHDHVETPISVHLVWQAKQLIRSLKFQLIFLPNF